MDIDFEKIRLDALAKATEPLGDSPQEHLAKSILNYNSKVTALMLKAYHEQLNQAVKQDQPPKNP